MELKIDSAVLAGILNVMHSLEETLKEKDFIIGDCHAEAMSRLRQLDEAEEEIRRLNKYNNGHLEQENRSLRIDLEHKNARYTQLEADVVHLTKSQDEIQENFASVFATDVLTPYECELVRENKKIQAIKAVRSRTGLGLRDAKDVMEKYANTLLPKADNTTEPS